MPMSPHSQLPRVEVLSSYMAYRDVGPKDAPVVLFLHGNPTSSYIWRDIIADVSPRARCIAPDLIGLGQSGKPDIEYRFVDHIRYLDAFIDALQISSAFIVAQDWGTAFAFERAARLPEFVRGLAFMEFIRPMESWDDFHQVPAARELFQKFRTPGIGEKLILEDNIFLERVLPGSVKRPLTEEEMSVYRAPFPTPEMRRPIWRFANQLPIEGLPGDVWGLLSAAHAALRESTYPKMLFVGEPGALVSTEFAEKFAATLTNCEVVPLGAGAHYLQEDHPRAIAAGVLRLLEGALQR